MIVTKAINFRDIFEDELNDFNSIVIPIIQRDFAQGRTTPNVNKIRHRFLKALYDALVEDKPITLDFIYGNVNNSELTPLDGQQRLSTLFLLHYYVAHHEQVGSDDYAFLARFSYQTRVSSRKFCQHLINYEPRFDEPLSTQIRDQAWFLMEWDNDPTVQSMLVMLDAIDEMFNSTIDIWPKLMGDAITFYFLPLKEMGATDELYIKMNSRGKPLTRFEHFKAELELRMKEIDEKKASEIISKIDLEWTDLLWPYRNSATGDELDEITDDEFLRYIHFISDIISYKNGEAEIVDDFDIIEKQFSSACEAAQDNIITLERYFDLFADLKKEGVSVGGFFDSYVSRNVHQAGKILIEERDRNDTLPDLFSECCRGYRRGNMFPLGRTLLLYAFVLYLDHRNEIADTDFRRRIRIVNNLVKSSSNTLRSEYMGELLQQVDKIILQGIVKQVEEGRARFENRQMQEEKEKLQWTTEHPNEAEILFKLEDHPLLNGYMSVVGLAHVDWCERFYSLFSCNLNAVNRALLATGSYFQKDRWRSQIGAAEGDTYLATIPKNKPYLNVWRTLFGPTRDNSALSEILCNLLEKHSEFDDNTLNEIAWDYLTRARLFPFKYYLLKYPYALKYNRFGKFYWREQQLYGRKSYKVIMMTTEFGFGKNYDFFIKTLCEILGGEKVGVQMGNYSNSEYSDDEKAKLYLTQQQMCLTLDDNEYILYSTKEGQNIEVERLTISQNDDATDTEDRVLVGLNLINKYMHLYNENEIRAFIERCAWTFAKTMPQWPHESIVKEKCPLSAEEFEHFVWAQRVLGVPETWGSYRQPYLHIDDYKYWTMGSEVESTTIIYRAKLN